MTTLLQEFEQWLKEEILASPIDDRDLAYNYCLQRGLEQLKEKYRLGSV